METGPDSVMAGRFELLKAYGLNSLSFHTMQPGLDYFDLDSDGYVAYKDYGGCRFALSDPVCSRGEMARITREFDAAHRSITWFHITDASAEALDKIGYYVNEMGEEAIIDLPTYSFAGRAKMDIRHLHNTAIKAGVEVVEIYGDRNIYAAARKMSQMWLNQLKKKSKELWFITRRPIYEDYLNVRKFYCFQKGVLKGFIYFDPVWAGGQVQGYCPAVLRRSPDAPEGALAWIVHEAMEKFKAQGTSKLYLGLMPAHGIEDSERRKYRYSPFTMWLFKQAYESKIANRLYGFKPLSFHKTRYRAESRKVYMATRSRYPLRGLIWSGRLTGVI